MTETAMQMGFPGLAEDTVAGDVVEKCRAMLQAEPATREDYELAWLTYLRLYHGLDWWVVKSLLEVVRRAGVPSFRTVANRCQELIRADASLQPPKAIMDLRQKQRWQGRVK